MKSMEFMMRPFLLLTPLSMAIACSTEKIPDEEITLENCEGSVTSDVPEIYSSLFKCVDMSMDGDNLVINSDGLAPHKSAYYSADHPNYIEWDDSRGEGYYINPNTISTQDISFSIPINPTSRGLTIDSNLVDGEVGSSNNEYGMGTSGLGLDGVSIYNSLAAPGDDIADELFSFDRYDGHPDQSGSYHYHTSSPGPLEVLASNGIISNTTPGYASIEIYGIMCDGTFVLGCTEMEGSEPDNSNFDAQNGHIHTLSSDSGTIENRYHVHVCPSTYTDYIFTPEIQAYDSCK